MSSDRASTVNGSLSCPSGEGTFGIKACSATCHPLAKRAIQGEGEREGGWRSGGAGGGGCMHELHKPRPTAAPVGWRLRTPEQVALRRLTVSACCWATLQANVVPIVMGQYDYSLIYDGHPIATDVSSLHVLAGLGDSRGRLVRYQSEERSSGASPSFGAVIARGCTPSFSPLVSPPLQVTSPPPKRTSPA